MKTVGQLVRQRREEREMTLAALADKVGATKGYLSMIENHRVGNPPSQGLLEALEKALEIPAGELVRAAAWESAPEPVRASAEAGAELARLLKDKTRRRGDGARSLDDPALRKELLRLIEATLPEQSAGKAGGGSSSSGGIGSTVIKLSRGKVPLINKVAAGYPSDFTDLDYPARVADEYVWAPPDLADPDAFAATVVGDSMLPEYREGDVVIFSPAAKVVDGCDCFVRLEPDQQTTFKRVFFDGKKREKIRLQPLNPKFPPQTLARDQVSGLYRAVGRYQKV